MRHTKGKWRADPEHTAEATTGIEYLLLRGLQFIQYGFTPFVETLTNLIEVHTTGCSLDKGRAEPEFQVL